MTTARELITRSLRLINQPGRGSKLGATDQDNALEALQQLLDSESVSKQVVPGTRTHFFAYPNPQNLFSYGNSPQFDFDSGPFGLDVPDEAPTSIETVFIRTGSSIINNEQIDEYRFYNVGNWIVAGGAVITNNALTIEQAIGSANQSLPGIDILGNTTYTLRVSVVVNNGSATLNILDTAVVLDSFVFDSSGIYEFDFVWPVCTDPQLTIETLLVTDDVEFTQVSLIERGHKRLELPDAVGTDYPVRQIDQNTYSLQPVKGQGGQLYQLFYSRAFNQEGELRFDTTAQPNGILVMDVLTNTIAVTDINQTLRINPESIRWLTFALADEVSGEYGKMLNPRQIKQMNQAWDRMAAANRRINNLRVDRGVQTADSFRWSINRGDF